MEPKRGACDRDSSSMLFSFRSTQILSPIHHQMETLPVCYIALIKIKFQSKKKIWIMWNRKPVFPSMSEWKNFHRIWTRRLRERRPDCAIYRGRVYMYTTKELKNPTPCEMSRTHRPVLRHSITHTHGYFLVYYNGGKNREKNTERI